MKKGKSIVRVVIIAVLLLIGLGIMGYPFISNYIFENRRDSLIRTYDDVASNIDDAEREAEFERVRKYNEALFSGNVQLHDPFSGELIGASEDEYNDLLRINDTSLMGYIRIPSIDVDLPIYHGTSDEVLESGVGHLEGTSLPIGGVNTHSVLTGHTGLSSAKLFTDINQLEEGDIFILNIYGENLAYEVDQIKVVEPDNQDDLHIVKGEDYCTLLTCTPYGVNSHRLLVRGTRVPYEEEYSDDSTFVKKTSESTWMAEYRDALIVSVAIIVGLVLVYLVISRVEIADGGVKMKSKIIKVLGLIFIIVGVLVYLYPNLVEWRLESRTESIVEEVKNRVRSVETEDIENSEEYTEKSSDKSEFSSTLEDTYRDMVAYNNRLISDGQELVDAWSYAQTPISISGIEEGEPVGYIEIPDMDVTLPLYIGASELNMSLGAAVMSETSMPIGGESTNSVIVGHRGYSGAPYFREIERLKEGSIVTLNTLWGKLTYRAFEIKIIDPSDLDSILIRPNEDIITLLTCHPYMSGGRQRYCVFCRRVSNDETAIENSTETESGSDRSDSSSGLSGALIVSDSSRDFIELERIVRVVIPLFLIVILFIIVIKRMRGKKK